MRSWITTARITDLLDTLYADTAINDPLVRRAAGNSDATGGREDNFYQGMRKACMAVGRDFGHLLDHLARGTKAKTVVEFGTSFGVSTTLRTSAIRDHGGGRVITTEFEEKAARARGNLAAAGLTKRVEFRTGDALETLPDSPSEIDMLLDGAKGLYLSVLKLLEPRLLSGALIASDNTDHEGMEAFLAHIRNPDQGYRSAAIFTAEAGSRRYEITIRH